MKNILPLLALLSLSFLLTDCKTLMGGKNSSSSSTRARSAPAGISAYSTTSDLQSSYIQLYKNEAVAEMQRTGIPASITLAQGMLESSYGQSPLAKEANNHFGIKCGGGWTGASYHKKDDDYDPTGNLTESCFRKYRDPNESFYDHSEFIRDPRKANRYGFLFNLDHRDYQGWAKGLQSAGYATSGTYASQLISLIERYQLNIYDDPGALSPDPTPIGNQPGNQNNAGGGTQPANPGNGGGGTQPANPGAGSGIALPPMERIHYINDAKYVSSQPGETMQDIARMYSLPVEKVQGYNENGYPFSAKLTPGSNVYIQHKHDRYRGRANSHFIKADQTMFEVSQLYGISLNSLLQRNNLQRGEEPASGEKILLRGKRPGGEKPRLRDSATPVITPNTTPPSTTNPGNKQPVDNSPTPVSGNNNMTPDTNDELFEIGGEDPKPATTPAPVVTPPSQPTVPPPSTSGTPYPGEPSKPPASSWPGTTPSKPTTPTTTTTPQGTFYTVEKGETLFRVAQKFNTTVTQLKQLNNLNSDYIQAGQRLRVK